MLSKMIIKTQAVTQEFTYPNQLPYVEESRGHPAWMYRDLEHPIWEQPIVILKFKTC